MAKVIFMSKNPDGSANGGMRFFLHKPYGSQDLIPGRRVNTARGEQVVYEANGGLKVDDLLKRQLAYFFGVEFPVDSFLNVKVSMWGKCGENFLKANPQERDSFMFFGNSWRLNQFAKRDGGVGYELVGSAFDYCRLRSAQDSNGQTYNAAPRATAPAPAQTAAPRAAAAPAPVRTAAPAPAPAAAPAPAYSTPGYTAADFAAVDDSDDLPF